MSRNYLPAHKLTLSALLMLFLSSLPSAKAVEVQYKISKMHGLLGFVLAISGEANRPEGIRRIFERSVFNTPEAKQLLRDWRKLRPALDRGIGSSEEQFRQGTNQVLIKLVEQSIHLNSFESMRKGTRTLLSEVDHQELFRILGAFTPAYEALVWKKSLPELEGWQKKLETLTKKINTNAFFSKAVTFYKANWPTKRIFTVGLYAVPFIPGEENFTNSRSMSATIEHGLLTIEGKRHASTGANEFAVIFHEMCHSLYDSQSKSDAGTLDRWYVETLPPHGEEAGKLINEALATAIGNGWVYETIGPKKDNRKNWYADSAVNSFAQEIFPLLKSYLEKSKPIDPDFVKSSVEMFVKIKK